MIKLFLNREKNKVSKWYTHFLSQFPIFLNKSCKCKMYTKLGLDWSFYRQSFTSADEFSTVITARKRSLGQGNIFTPVCHSVHRAVGLPQWMMGYTLGPGTPPGPGTPLDQAPPWTRHPPRTRHPQTRHPLGPGTPPRPGTPQCRACWEIRSVCGWYTSYWNAILLDLKFHGEFWLVKFKSEPSSASELELLMENTKLSDSTLLVYILFRESTGQV